MATRDGISIQDRWIDAEATASKGRPVLKDAKVRCPKGSRYFVRVWDPRTPAKMKPNGMMGKPGSYATKCFPSVKLGQEWATEVKAEFIKGTSSAVTTMMETLGDSYCQSLQTRIDGAVTDRYLAQVRQVIAVIVAAGGKSITDPAFPDIVQRMLSTLLAKRPWQKRPHPASPGLKRKFLVIARSIMRYAQERRLVAYNPLVPVKVGRVEVKRKPIFMVPELRLLVSDLSRWKDRGKREQTRRMLDAHGGIQSLAAADLGISPSTMHYRLNSAAETDPWWMVAVLLAYTGCRLSEALSMTPRMVNLESGFLLLPSSVAGNKMKRDRRIRLQFELRLLLTDIITSKMVKPDSPLVGEHFTTYVSSNLTNGFKDYCRRCGISPGYRGPHALRHTFCAIMTALGASPFLVMEMVGHTSAQVAKNYSASAEEVIDHIADWPRHETPRLYLRAVPIPGEKTEKKITRPGGALFPSLPS